MTGWLCICRAAGTSPLGSTHSLTSLIARSISSASLNQVLPWGRKQIQSSGYCHGFSDATMSCLARRLHFCALTLHTALSGHNHQTPPCIHDPNMYPIQRCIATGKLFGKINWRISKGDNDFIERNTVQTFKQVRPSRSFPPLLGYTLLHPIPSYPKNQDLSLVLHFVRCLQPIFASTDSPLCRAKLHA